MKAFVWGLVVLVIVSTGAIVYLKYFSPSPDSIGTGSYQSESVTKTGTLKKSAVAKSDFTHVVIAPDASTGVASFTLNLDDYIDKNVEVTGQFSGTTLFADTIRIIE